MDAEKAINEILQDLEHQPLQDRRTFKAYMNNPELISVSSTNAQKQSPSINYNTNNGYYNFTINLPRPAIGAKSLQLLKAIIPQAQCSIPDYSLVFPYYKLRTVPISNTPGKINFVDAPSYENLYFIRLLPSYYKKEDLKAVTGQSVSDYGYNKTFNYYEELETELRKACLSDLTFYNSNLFNFVSGDISITYSNDENKFKLRGNNYDLPPALNEIPLWIPGINYVIGDTRYYNMRIYRAVANSIDIPPDPTKITPWRELKNQNTYTLWDDTYTYSKYNVIQYNGIIYQSLTDNNLNNVPNTNPTQWLNVSQYFVANPFFNYYMVASYDDPNVKLLLSEIERISTSNDCVGTSKPGNLYVENQTLARRIGFTWDNTGLITDINKLNSNLDIGIAFGSTVALFYNRLRPVLNYDFVVEFEDEGDLNISAFYDNDRISYTADGYCNLVYSSIINIYTTIIGTSSVDTQRNANLLATLEMNCPNLGILMANNFIDTKLTKIQPDIYSIYFELRDENGVEYYLTNNATTTLLLKLTYPE